MVRRCGRGGAAPSPWQGHAIGLEFDLLRNAQRVLNLDPQISDRTFQLRVPKQQLNHPQVAGRRSRTWPLMHRSLTRSRTRSRPLSLLSMARLNKAMSRLRSSAEAEPELSKRLSVSAGASGR